jgi:hypothetical protein
MAVPTQEHLLLRLAVEHFLVEENKLSGLLESRSIVPSVGQYDAIRPPASDH